MKHDAIVGCLLGTAVGDALGLPYEGLSAQRARKLLGPPDRHRFFFGHGMISDDTEHTCMVAQSLIEAGGDTQVFATRFAKRLRWWILAFPAGVGKATARSGIKLWLGAKSTNAGVFSAGNGPAMRAAILGAAFDDVHQMVEFIRVSSRITHTDPKAEHGAIAVALAAKHSRQHVVIDANLWLSDVVEAIGAADPEWIELLQQTLSSVERGEGTQSFAASMGLKRGVTGYTYHTVPIVVHAWLSHPQDYRAAVFSIIQCGGDADTTAAIVGGIVGAGVGSEGIPAEWLREIIEYPRSISWMRHLGVKLADTLDDGSPGRAPKVNPVAVILRNLLFLFVVLTHGFRRIAPPY